MRRSKFAGSFILPVLCILSLPIAHGQTTLHLYPGSAATPGAPGAPLGYSASADSAGETAASVQEAAPAQAPDATPQADAQNPPPAPTEAQRAELARQAQARVRARRQQRIDAIVQDTYSHKYEIFGGYTYLRLRPGQYRQHATENGFDAGFTDYLTHKIGVTVDGRGYFGTDFVGDNPYGFFLPSISNYSIMAGPQYRFYMHEKWGISAVAMGGVARNAFYGNSQGLPGTYLGLYPDAWRLGASVGVPVDYNLSPSLSIRLTPNYYFTTFGGEAQYSKSFTGGLNFRFGRK